MISLAAIGEAPLGYPLSPYDPGQATMRKTLAAMVAVIVATNPVSASMTQTLGPIVTIAGTLGQLAPMGARPMGSPYYAVDPVTGYLSATLGAATSVTSGGPTSAGTLTQTLGPATGSATASGFDSATLIQTLGPATAISAGVITTGAVLSKTLAPVLLNAQIGVVVVGSLYLTLNELTGSATAIGYDRTANLTRTLDPATLVTSGGPILGTNLTATLGPVTGFSSGPGALFRRMIQFGRSQRPL